MPSASGGSGLMSWKACEPAWRRGWRCTISVSGSTSNLVVLARQPRHGRVQTPVARHYLPAVKIQHVASVVCQLPSSLLEYDTSRSKIPRPDAPLVVAVQPPRSHVAQIKRRRTQAPHALGDRREAFKEL